MLNKEFRSMLDNLGIEINKHPREKVVEKMNLAEIKMKLDECGGYLLHVGFLTQDIMEMQKKLSASIPGIGKWDFMEFYWPKEVMVVGPANTIQCSQAPLYGDVRIEIVAPVKGKSEGTHFEDYFKHREEGLHHFCYGLPTFDDFRMYKSYLEELGCKCVYHAKRVENGEVFCEFCYMEIIPYGLYIEVNCNIRRTAQRIADAAAKAK